MRNDCLLLALILAAFSVPQVLIGLDGAAEARAMEESHLKDLTRGRAPLDGFEAFEAKNKRAEKIRELRAPLAWGALGLAGAVGLLMLGFVYRPGREKAAIVATEPPVDARFPCPECGESIAVVAKHCRFCQCIISEKDRPGAKQAPEAPAHVRKTARRRFAK